MNVRKVLYFGYHRLMGSSFPAIYEDLVREDHLGEATDATKQLLVELLAHCQRSVPYYAALMKEVRGSFETDPEAYLVHLPILTKGVIREHFEQLKSLDLGQRKWFINASGGSTGEPVQVIQDRDHRDRSSALQQFYSTWAGLEIGDSEVYIWGSERDILGDSLGAKIKLSACNKLLRRTFLNAFRMTPRKMREFIHLLNTQRPKLIVAYAQAIYELARLAEREKIPIRPQSAIITSAGQLYPFMRETIEGVFKCKVFNRYSARELADIAGECPAHSGWHVFPKGCYSV